MRSSLESRLISWQSVIDNKSPILLVPIAQRMVTKLKDQITNQSELKEGPPKILDAPTRIYLNYDNISEDCKYDSNECTWTESRVAPSDIAYIRADLVPQSIY